MADVNRAAHDVSGTKASRADKLHDIFRGGGGPGSFDGGAF